MTIGAPRATLRRPSCAQGEYGLTNSLMKYGYNVATIMAMYRGVRRQYRCLDIDYKNRKPFASTGLSPAARASRPPPALLPITALQC